MSLAEEECVFLLLGGILWKPSVEREWDKEVWAGRILKAKHRYPQNVLFRPRLPWASWIHSKGLRIRPIHICR